MKTKNNTEIYSDALAKKRAQERIDSLTEMMEEAHARTLAGGPYVGLWRRTREALRNEIDKNKAFVAALA